MRILGFVIVATIFESVGDAVMRIALQNRYAPPGRIALFGLASVLLTMYGLFLNLAPVEFATVTGRGLNPFDVTWESREPSKRRLGAKSRLEETLW